MPDDFLTASSPPKRSSPLRGLLATAGLAFLLGGGLVTWLAWNGTLDLGFNRTAPEPAVSATVPASQPRIPLATAPTPSASASPAPLQQPALAGAFDQRVAALEARLSDLSLRAEAASGNATRAEGMLIAFAARRALERGKPLGGLADQLRLRFEAAEPMAVSTVLQGAERPVTLDALLTELDRLKPELTGRPANETGWGRFRREMEGLFTIRRGSGEGGDPDGQLERAKVLLRSGQIKAARDQVQAMPGQAAAVSWLGEATRYESLQQALDLLETAALKEPRELKGAEGRKVEQPSPVGV